MKRFEKKSKIYNLDKIEARGVNNLTSSKMLIMLKMLSKGG